MSHVELTEAEQELRALERAKAAIVARDSLLAYTKYTMPHPEDPDDVNRSLYEEAAHHQLIADALEKVERGEILRLIIMMPPRHGKSELASRRFPAWFMGRGNYRQLILATYAQDFAEDFGRDVREIIESPQSQQVFPHLSLKSDTKSASRMRTENRGILHFVGTRGQATGRGADVFLIDDPFKDREDAGSIAIRNKVWNFFKTTAYTRLMPGGAIVIIMTSWDEDDIVRRIFNPEYIPEEIAKTWTVLSLKGIANENTPREKALWPERYPLKVLYNIRSVLGPIDWSALYQQNPTPPEGAYFKRKMIIPYLYHSAKELPNNLRPYGAMDLAVSIEKDRDATCVGGGGVDENGELWIYPDIIWDKLPPDQLIEQIVQYIKFHNFFLMWGEKGQLTKAIKPFLTKAMKAAKVYNYIEEFPTTKQKGARATNIRGFMSMGMVHFPAFASWWPAALDEMLKFTGSGDDANDDFVDMIALLGQGLHKQIGATAAAPKLTLVPEVGTMAWVKYAHDQRRKQLKLSKANDGF